MARQQGTRRHGIRLAAAGLMLMSAQMASAVVVFGTNSCGGPGTCSDFSLISQDFGDTAQVNISYRAATAAGNTATVASRPWRYSDGAVSGANGAFVSPSSGAPDLVAEFRLDLLQAGTVTLNSVDLGTYFGSSETLDYYVWDDSWNPLGSGTVLVNPGALVRLALNLSSTTGLIFQFGSASLGGGIQNIDFSYSAGGPVTPGVPEPASWAMLLAGFGLVGSVRRRAPVAA